MRRVLVTGGAGFLGSYLCERLIANGDEVVCLDNFFTGARKNIEHLLDSHSFELLRHDVCEWIAVEVDEIYHLACPASPIHYQRNPVRTIRTCIQGTLRVLDLAREVGARVLLASTSEVYGDPQVHPQAEEYWGHVNPIGERACYDEGKRCAEALAVAYSTQYNVAVRIARVFNTYGPRMLADDGRVVSRFIFQCLREQPITLFGDGNQTRSFCYVDDLVEGLLRLMASSESGPVNLGCPAEISMLELAKKIRALIGSRSEIVHQRKPADDPARRRPDITLARERLGWEPVVSLDDGLSRTIDEFRRRACVRSGD